MPTAPPKPCSVPGCRNLTAARYCARHEKSERREKDQRRGSSTSRGYDRDWREFRECHAQNVPPICATCGHAGASKEMHLDHVVALAKGGERLDPSNVQWLCAGCHRVKTIREDGGFGRVKAVMA